MALLDLNAGVPAFEGRTIAIPSQPERLAPQERLVVLLSRRDPLSSLAPRGTGSRLAGWLFGIEAPHRLADEQLEALRRFAVLHRLRQGDAAEAADDARGAGFSSAQLAQVRGLVDSAYAIRPLRSVGALAQRILFALVGLLAFAGLTVWLTPQFDSVLVAFALTAVGALTLAPFAGQRAAG
jgi:hypothetical protein